MMCGGTQGIQRAEQTGVGIIGMRTLLTLPSKQKQIILLAFDRDWAKDENNLNKYDELDRKEYGEHEENEIEISEVEN